MRRTVEESQAYINGIITVTEHIIGNLPKSDYPYDGFYFAQSSYLVHICKGYVPKDVLTICNQVSKDEAVEYARYDDIETILDKGWYAP